MKQERKILDIRGDFLSNEMKKWIKAQGKIKIAVETARKIWQAEQPLCKHFVNEPLCLIKLITGIDKGSKVQFIPNAKIIGKLAKRKFVVKEMKKFDDIVLVKLKGDKDWYNIVWLVPAGETSRMKQESKDKRVNIVLDKDMEGWRFEIFLLHQGYDREENSIEFSGSLISVPIKDFGFKADTEAEKSARKMCDELGLTIAHVIFSHRKL